MEISSQIEALEKFKLSFGKRDILVSLIFEDRKRLRISVYPNKKIIVKSPKSKSRSEIEKHLYRKGNWIIKQINHFDQFHPLPIEKKFVSGETHCYLGRQYRLKIIKDDKTTIKLKGKYFIVKIPDIENDSMVKKIMDEWYKIHAKKMIKKKVKDYLEKIELFKNDKPNVSIKKMRKRWGSYSNNNILINVDLIKAPAYCIDYVIVHELCHLKYNNHGLGFFKLLTKIIPDWESRKSRLEKVII